jgi:hypothetical protein
MGPKQIVVALPNLPGGLAGVSELLAEAGIDIKALSITSEAPRGSLAMVVNDHAKALLILQAGGYAVSETPVIAAYTPDHPGGLKAVIKPLREAKINIDRLYMSVARKGEHAVLVLEVSDYEKAVAALKAEYVELIEGEFRF